MKYNIETKLNISGLNTDDEIIKAFPFIKNIKKAKPNNMDEWVCFNYALDIYDDDLYSQEAFNIVKKNYIQIPLKLANKGDLIVYLDEDDDDTFAVHYGIIQKANKTLNSVIIRSKWGIYGVYETNIYDVPNLYGNKITIWRKKRKNEIYYS